MQTELEQELTAWRTDVPRAALLGWCVRAGQCMFHVSETKMLTEWGARMARTLLVILVERKDCLSPELGAWIEENLLPCLFCGTPGSIDTVHADLVYLLVKAALQGIQSTP